MARGYIAQRFRANCTYSTGNVHLIQPVSAGDELFMQADRHREAAVLKAFCKSCAKRGLRGATQLGNIFLTHDPPKKLGRPVTARVQSARVGTRPTCSAYPGPAPPPTCHLGGVDLLTNKSYVGEQLL